MSLGVLAQITTEMAREMAVNSGVCIRPVLKRVYDRDTSSESQVPIACGSTREAVCPPCARKARTLRIQQCSEGWHRDTEPRPNATTDKAEDQADEDGSAEGSRRVRSTRRRPDAAELPQVPMANRTVGRTFTTPDGKEYRPSMFLTLTLPSYGPIRPGTGMPAEPASYDYRRAALDALHFPKLVDRFWQNLRRCAGYKVQYFAALEPQARLAPHLHAAMRGVIPRAVLKKVIEATYLQVWWPPHDRPVYVHRQPVWTGEGYCDPDTGAMLPTWAEALDQMEADPDARPAHVMRFGSRYDVAGIIAPSPDADRAVRYLAKYLTKAVADPLGDQDSTPAREAHIDRLHDQLRWLPCSPHCANWLRYGIQPDQPGPGLTPGRCTSKAHDREHLGCGGRRVLVSRDWSGKTLAKHKADRAAVVREALDAAGMLTPDLERMAAGVLSPDGLPRFVWTDDKPDPTTYTLSLLRAVAERQRWRAQYEAAKSAAAVDNCSATGTGPPAPDAAHSSASPDNPPSPGPQDRQSRVSEANPEDTSPASALDGRTEGPTLPNRGRPSPQAPSDASRCQPPENGS
jgi:Replication initiator protein, pSAM2